MGCENCIVIVFSLNNIVLINLIILFTIVVVSEGMLPQKFFYYFMKSLRLFLVASETRHYSRIPHKEGRGWGGGPLPPPPQNESLLVCL
jgi:energy-coupling factor transporter transmembrane protein EcfT